MLRMLFWGIGGYQTMNILKSIKNLSRFELALWGFSFVGVSLSFLLSPEKDYLSLIGSLIGVTALIFVAKGDVFGQMLTVIFSLFYGIVSFRFHYYGEMITYLGMTTPINIASIVTWLRNPYSEKEVKVSVMTPKKMFWLLVVSLVVTAAFYFILGALGTANLFMSTTSVFTSFAASALMMFRSPYYAVAYAANDIVLIVLWFMASVEDTSYIPMIICFVMFLFNDIYAFINWNRMRRRQFRGE